MKYPKTFGRKAKPEKKDYAKKLRKNMTVAERRLWFFLRMKRQGVKFRRQKIILGYIVDFYCPSQGLVVEVDGSAHTGRENYDRIRDAAMRRIGLKVVRVTNEEVMKSTPVAIDRIRAAFN